ncbi:MAG TPA: PAS domain-containing protein, partial [Niastella sp.]
ELQSLNEELYTLNTEHQVKIKELVELNDDLNNYFRSTNIAQIFLDAQLNIRKFNPASTEIINFIESDLGRPFSDITANFKYNQLIDDIRYVERTRIVVEKEVALHQGKNFLLRIMPYITREKKYAGVIITFVDITTITNLNNIIRSVFNATTSAIFALHAVTDPRGVIVDFTIDAANEKAQEWFGSKEVGLTGKSMRNTVPVLTSQELFGEYLSVVLDDVKLHRDVVLESMDMWFELTAAKMPDGLVVTFTDITDKKKAVQKIRRNYSELNEVKENLRKLNKELEDKVKDRTRELSFSEERFRLVARATNDTLWDWDLTADKMWWSDAFRKTFGYAEAQMTRKEWLEHVHPDDRDTVKKSVHNAIHDNDHQWSQEYRFLKADGDYANVLDRGYILHNEFGVPYRMLGSMLDLTALRKAEQEIKMMNEVLEEKVKQRTEQLQAMNQELESSNRDLQLFASVASHDLQEPLRKIHMLTKMVKDRHEGELGDDTVIYLNKIMQSAMRMKALVNNILHFSKLSNDLSGFEKTDV